MLNRLFLLFILAGFGNMASAQKPGWAWAKSPYNTNVAVHAQVVYTNKGEIYTTGNYTGSVKFGDSTYSAASQGIYVVKYNDNGDLLWSRGFKGTAVILATALCADSNSDLYIGGRFTGTIYLGDSSFVSHGSKDIFLMKLSHSGTFLWAKSYGARYDDIIGGMAIDQQQNVVINGYFSDTLLPIGTYSLKSRYGAPQSLLIKHNRNGQLMWATQSSSKGGDEGSNLAIDKKGDIYTVGNFGTSVNFDTIKLESISEGFVTGDIYLAKYDASGTAMWANTVGAYRPPGGTTGGGLYPALIAIDSAGNPIIGSGYDVCCVKFKNGDIMPDPRNPEIVGMWFGKFSIWGDYLWVKFIPGTSSDYTHKMTCDKLGDIYMVGEYYSFDRVFDTDTAYYPSGSSLGQMFVAKYLNSGKFSWLQTAGTSTCGVVPQDVAVHEADELVTVGQFFGDYSINFGTSTCINTGTVGNGFIAKLSKSATDIRTSSLKSLQLFPNPASSFIRIRSSELFTSYTITNTIGQIVGSGHLKPEDDQMVTIPPLPAGTYFINLVGQAVVTKKFLIQ